MGKRSCVLAVILLLAAAGCGEGDASSEPVEAKSRGASPESRECFTEVLKAVNLTLKTAEGAPSGSDEQAEFAAFGEVYSGTPTWDIYKTYVNMGAKDLAQGTFASSTDAVGAYAPSVKLECVRAYEGES